MVLMPWVAGSAVATVFSAALLVAPAALALRRLIGRRPAVPLDRGRVERHLVLAAAVIGGIGAVAWADAIALVAGGWPQGSAELGSILLGFVARVPLASVPWFAAWALSGASVRPWRSLLSAAAAASAASWAAYALCWAGGTHLLSPETGLIQLAASMVAALSAGQTYLATRGDQRARLPVAALALEDL